VLGEGSFLIVYNKNSRVACLSSTVGYFSLGIGLNSNNELDNWIDVTKELVFLTWRKSSLKSCLLITDNGWFEVHKNCPWYMLPSICFGKESIEGIVFSAKRCICRHHPICIVN